MPQSCIDLSSSPVLHTGSRRELQSYLGAMGRVSASSELERRDGFRAKINEIAIGSVRAQYSYFSHPLEIGFKGAGSFCYLLKLGGSMRVMSGGVDIELQVGESVIVPAFCDYAVAVGDQSSFLIFKFDEKALFTRSKMIGRPEASEDVLMLPTHERLGENGRSRTDTVAMALARQFSDKIRQVRLWPRD